MEKYMESEESGDVAGKVKALIAQLEPLAEKEGCSVADLVEKYTGEDEEAESEEGGGKLSLIVARMKSKNKPEEFEG